MQKLSGLKTFFLTIILTLPALLTVASAQVSEIALHDHALRLAIAQFNPGHDQPLKQHGEKHLFMLNFLKETIKQFPAVGDLPFYAAENRYRVLTVKLAQTKKQPSARRQLEILTLKKVFRLFSENCAYEQKRVFNRTNLSSKKNKSKELSVVAYLAEMPTRKKQCRHPLMNGIAKNLNLVELEWKEYLDEDTHVVSLNFASSLSQDLKYIQRKLQDSSLPMGRSEISILRALTPAPLSRQNDYYESLIVLHPQDTLPAGLSSPVMVEFIDRFERAGEIFTYHRLIQGKPLTAPASGQHFQLQLVREWGTPRP